MQIRKDRCDVTELSECKQGRNYQIWQAWTRFKEPPSAGGPRVFKTLFSKRIYKHRFVNIVIIELAAAAIPQTPSGLTTRLDDNDLLD